MEQEQRDEKIMGEYLEARPKIAEDIHAFVKKTIAESIRNEFDLNRLKTELLKELRDGLTSNTISPESAMERMRIAGKLE